jgi:arylsulfatase A-like enzyme
VLLIIDGLAMDCLKVNANDMEYLPTFKKIMQEGLVCENCFSHGAPTEFSMPSIFTSTYPLDYGGYEYGLRDRPNSILEVAKSEGYETALFSNTFVLDKLFYFDKGVDCLKSLYDIELVWRVMKRAYLWHVQKDYYGSEYYINKCSDVLSRFFGFIIDLAERQNRDKKRKFVKTRVYQYDFEKIISRLKKELNGFKKNNAEYVKKNIDNIMMSTLNSYLKIEPGKNIFRRVLGRLNGLYLPFTRIMFKGYEKNVSSETIFNACVNWLKERKKETNYFATLHLMDMHDELYSGGGYLIKPDIKHSDLYENYDWKDARQMLSLSYIDDCLKKFIEDLKELNEYENTVLIITSDHGLQAFNNETVLSSTSPAGCFKDIYLSVPFIIFGKNIKPEVNSNITTSCDVAPTICELMGAPIPTTYKGVSLISNKAERKKNVVISEHTHRGPCSFDKPIYISIRDLGFKYIWKEDVSKYDKSSKSRELIFNLKKDKEEMNDLLSEMENTETLKYFREIKDNRIMQIKNHH